MLITVAFVTFFSLTNLVSACKLHSLSVSQILLFMITAACAEDILKYFQNFKNINACDTHRFMHIAACNVGVLPIVTFIEIVDKFIGCKINDELINLM